MFIAIINMLKYVIICLKMRVYMDCCSVYSGQVIKECSHMLSSAELRSGLQFGGYSDGRISRYLLSHSCADCLSI